MAVEPLRSVMGVQAQSTVAAQKQTQTPAEKLETAENILQPVEKVDGITAAAENAQGKGQKSNNGEQNQDAATNEQIRKAVEQMNKRMNHSEAVFGIHEGTNRVMIKIIDSDTKEVIKELPPEKTLDMIEKVWELAGILIDERR